VPNLRSVTPRLSRIVKVAGAVVSAGSLVAVPLSQLTPTDVRYTDSVIAKDAFPGTAHALQSAEIGGAWTSELPSGASATAGGGQLDVTGLGLGRGASQLLPSATGADVTVKHGLTLPTVSSRRLGLYETTTLRRQTDGDRYGATLVVDAAGALTLRLDRVVDGATVTLARAVPSVTAASGAKVNVEAEVSGTSPVTFHARVWRDGQAVPAWQVSAQDSSAAAIKAGGSVGLSEYVSSSGTATSLSLSSFQATSRVAVVDSSVSAPTTGLPQVRPTYTAGFQHPGVVNTASSLSQARDAAVAGKQPWASALTQLKGSRYSSLSWVPRPVASVGCGSYNTPNEGCTAETDDAQAAYADALMWYFTGSQAHADKSKQILNAWSGTLREHKFDTTTYKNGRLQAAWAAQVFTKAAELVRYSGAGWSTADVQRFDGMLKTAFLPLVRDGWTGGGANWQLSMADATVAIGVFTNDRSVFDDGVGDWRQQIRAAIYLPSDGPKPVLPAGTVITASGLNSYWRSPTSYVPGLEGETCRDADHMTMGLSSAMLTAETAGAQGVDLYGQESQRLVAAMEYNTRFLNDPKASGWVCPAPISKVGTAWKSTWEVGYHHYAGLSGVAMPQTQRLLQSSRPARSELFMNFETLTHGTA